MLILAAEGCICGEAWACCDFWLLCCERISSTSLRLMSSCSAIVSACSTPVPAARLGDCIRAAGRLGAAAVPCCKRTPQQGVTSDEMSRSGAISLYSQKKSNQIVRLSRMSVSSRITSVQMSSACPGPVGLARHARLKCRAKHVSMIE